MTESKPDKVRAALAKGGLTMQEIADKSGMPIDEVRPVVWNMTRARELVLSKTYRLAKKPKAAK